VVKRLRHILDVIASWVEPHCPDDWNEAHLDFESCCRCERVAQRSRRIARHRAQGDFPTARVNS
jgi:hypothetical protein